jgi:hypothetical protein
LWHYDIKEGVFSRIDPTFPPMDHMHEFYKFFEKKSFTIKTQVLDYKLRDTLPSFLTEEDEEINEHHQAHTGFRENEIIKLIPASEKIGEQLLGKLLTKIVAVADNLATADPKASQQGREPGHVVTVVEFAHSTVAQGTEPGSTGFDDVRQDLVDRIDRLLAALRDWSDVRGEGRVPAGQDMLEVLHAVERKIIALDLKVSGFATSAHAALLHALVAHTRADNKRVPAVLNRARYNIVRAYVMRVHSRAITRGFLFLLITFCDSPWPCARRPSSPASRRT